MTLSSQKSPSFRLTAGPGCTGGWAVPLVCCCPPAVSPGVWQGSDKETQRARQEAAGVSAKGSNCSKGPVPPPGSQLPQPLARELFYKTLLWGVTETFFRGTASAQPWQLPRCQRKASVFPWPGTAHSQGGMTQGCRSRQHCRIFSPTEQGRGAGGCTGQGVWEQSRSAATGFQVDSTIHM